MEFSRLLDLRTMLAKKSFFLFGPRSTGKTYLIRHQLADATIYDLLDDDTFARLSRRPALLEEELDPRAGVVVIDEIQKLPTLLDTVHRIIESRRVRFLLTGSSSRKLRRGGGNLLGGRAWEARLHPLCFPEIPDFDLLQYLNRGGLPHIYPSENHREELRAYCGLYLREEIVAEALVRRVDHFARFLDVMALQNGEELHFQGLASDAGIPARTIQNYVEILEDTLAGFQVPAFRATQKRKAITRSKFFFFDVGVVGQLAHRGEILAGAELFGRAFEHFLMLELRAYLDYQRLDLPLQYWRSTSGFEVDAVIGRELALEIKSSELVGDRGLRGLRALAEEKRIKAYAVVSRDPRRRRVGGITIYPWREFLGALWSGEIL